MHASPHRFPRRLPLGLIVSTIFCASASNTASALTLLVTDCGDGPSSGTLRNTIAAAPDNSVIQIPLMCSKITLTQGAIYVPYTLQNLYIVGQGPSATVIDGGSTSTPAIHDLVFLSQHTGTLGFSQLTITHGHPTTGAPIGGCVSALLGNLGFNHAVVTECERASTDSAQAIKGGGIYAAGSVSLVDSTVSNNTATAGPSTTSFGGGIYAKKGVSALSSTISGNAAIAGASGGYSNGGGIYTLGGNTLISKSTISGNRADDASALHVFGTGNYTLSIISSTIVNNVSNHYSAVKSYAPTTITNSTIAYNRAGESSDGRAVGIFSNYAIVANNSIFASNTSSTGIAYDVSGQSLTGSMNLITAPDGAVPLDTLFSCPLLGHLSSNGGLTQTIPLLKGSPAIDTGAANGQTTDQRGTGFARTVGSGTDIGAYERQSGVVDDVIFFGQFEGRCD